MAYIYALIDPRDNQVRYIGKANDAQKRYAQHKYEKNSKQRSPKISWIKSLSKQGLEPILHIIEETDNWQERECFWIDFYRDKTKLLNLKDGGDGIDSFSPYHRLMLMIKSKGAKDKARKIRDQFVEEFNGQEELNEYLYYIYRDKPLIVNYLRTGKWEQN